MLKGYEIGNDLAERRLAVYEFLLQIKGYQYYDIDGIN